MDTTGLTPKKMRKGRNGKRGTRYYGTDGTLVAKTCAKCDQVLPIDNFNPAKAQSDGYFSSCRPCASKAQKEYRYGDSKTTGRPTQQDKYREKYTQRTDEEFQQAIRESYPQNTKKCPECQIVKQLEEFYKNKAYSTGVSVWCKPCTSQKSAKRQAKVAEADPEYYRNNNTKAYERYMSRTDEEILLKQGDLYPDHLKTCKRCETGKNLTEFQATKRTPDGLTRYCKSCNNDRDRIRRKKKYEAHWRAHNIPFECYICQGPYEHSDHVIPTKLGGSDEPTNRLPICAYHNSSKNGTLLEDWLATKHHDIMAGVLDKVMNVYNVEISPLRK